MYFTTEQKIKLLTAHGYRVEKELMILDDFYKQQVEVEVYVLYYKGKRVPHDYAIGYTDKLLNDKFQELLSMQLIDLLTIQHPVNKEPLQVNTKIDFLLTRKQ